MDASLTCRPCRHDTDLWTPDERFDWAAKHSDIERCEACPFQWEWMRFVGFTETRTTLANARMLWLSIEALLIESPTVRRKIARQMPEDPEPEWWPALAPPPSRPQSGMITGSMIERIKNSVRLEDVVMMSCNLHGYGNVMKAKCPLHGEQNGESLVVWVDQQKWRCFGKCLEHGDVLDWIKLAHGKGIDWLVPKTNSQIDRSQMH